MAKKRWYRFGIEFAVGALKLHFWRWSWTWERG